MAINYDAQSKGRQLDAFSAMQTSTGVDEKLTSAPVIDAQMQPIEPAQQPVQVAGGNPRKQLLEQVIKGYDTITDPVGDIIGRLLNPRGGLLKTQQKLKENTIFKLKEKILRSKNTICLKKLLVTK